MDAEPYPEDHTRTLAWVGAAMIAAALLAVALGLRSAVTVTSLVWGSLIICLALYLRFRGIRRYHQHVETLAALEVDQHRFEQYRAVLETIVQEGLPEGLSLDELRSWIDDSVTRLPEKGE